MEWIDFQSTLAGLMAVRFYRNTLATWLFALSVMLVTSLVLIALRRFVAKRLRALPVTSTNRVLHFLANLVETTTWMLPLAFGLWAGSLVLDLPSRYEHIARALPTLGVLLQAAFWGRSLIEFQLDRLVQSKEHELEKQQLVTLTGPVKFISLLVLWSLLLLIGLDNLGVNVTALVTGLGIGGIAIALAVQNILGDLFASMTIALDKPFVVGDFVIIEDFMGTVERVGLKTTRIRSLSGEQIIFSNSDLLKSRIKNYKRMSERRVVFQFGITYQTPLPLLRQIPGMLKEIVERQEKTRFDRAHFFRYGESSLDFEVVYFVLDPDYNLYMDIHQEIHLAIFEQFEKAGVSFAYPTQTLNIQRDPQEEATEERDFESILVAR